MPATAVFDRGYGRAALEDGGTDEHLCSEGTLSENAWPRSKTADGGRPGTETERGTRMKNAPLAGAFFGVLGTRR